MCDNDQLEEMARYPLQVGVSRRRFGALTLGAGALAAVSELTNAAAVETVESEITIKTDDGNCDAYFVHPSAGKSPAVLIWPDIFGLRPTFRQMGKRLAESGYAVLVVNPFYRVKKAPTAPEKADFSDPETRKALMALAGGLSPQTASVDAKAFVGWLDRQSAVDTKKKMGTTGYCMGGPYTMRTAAMFPNRIGAGASFHGGGLVTDKPDSPHLLVPKMTASFLFAIAKNDDEKQPDVKEVLKKAFAEAKLPAEIEVYNAAHGWCPPDSAVYNAELAEKAWARLLATFKSALV